MENLNFDLTYNLISKNVELFGSLIEQIPRRY